MIEKMKLLHYKCPQEVRHSFPVDFPNLTFFGCLTYIHVNEGKFESRTRKCIFMGYGLGVMGHRLGCNKFRRIIPSRYVVYDELSMLASASLDIVVTNI